MKKILILALGLFSMILTGCSSNTPKNPNPINPNPPVEEKETYTFTFNGEHCTIYSQDSYEEGTYVSLTIAPDNGYELPEEIEVTGINDYNYDYLNGIFSAYITNNVVINCVAYQNYYVNYIMGYTVDTNDAHLEFEITEDFDNNSFTMIRTSFENGVTTVKKTTKKLNSSYLIEEIIDESLTDGLVIFKDIYRYEYGEDSILTPKKETTIKVENGAENVKSYIERTFYDKTSSFKGKVKEEIHYTNNLLVKKKVFEYSEEFESKEIYYSYTNNAWELDYTQIHYIEDDTLNKRIRYYVKTIEGQDEYISEEKIYDYSGELNLLVESITLTSKETYEYNENNDLKATKRYHFRNNEWVLVTGEDYTYVNGLLVSATSYAINNSTKEKEVVQTFKYLYNEEGFVKSVVFSSGTHLFTLDYIISKRLTTDKYIGPYAFAQTIGYYLPINDITLGSIIYG